MLPKRTLPYSMSMTIDILYKNVNLYNYTVLFDNITMGKSIRSLWMFSRFSKMYFQNIRKLVTLFRMFSKNERRSSHRYNIMFIYRFFNLADLLGKFITFQFQMYLCFIYITDSIFWTYCLYDLKIYSLWIYLNLTSFKINQKSI